MLTYDVKDKELSKDNPVYLTIKATDKIGGVAKVEYYINGKNYATINYRDAYKKSASGWDISKGEEATTKASKYIQEKYGEDSGNLGYTTRNYYKFDTQKSGCNISEGYLIIIGGVKNWYDMRVSKDLNKVETCYKGIGINYDDTYNLLFKGGKGDYRFYAKTYDVYGAIDKSAEIKFSLK